MTETITQRAERLAQDIMQPDYLSPTRHTVAATLRELAAAHEAMAAERNEALAAVTTAEQLAANAGAERDRYRLECRFNEIQWKHAEAERDALAAEVAALRNALEHFIKAHDTARYEPTKIAYENAKIVLAGAPPND